MADRLVADLNLIEECARAVQQIERAFANPRARVDQVGRTLGSKDLDKAFEDFTGNWDHHRERLRSDLRAFSTWATKASAALRETDKKMADVLKQGAKK